MPSISDLSGLKKILIANRGEIACRVIKTAQRLGIQSVAIYSDADHNCMHVDMADEAYNIGKAPSQESYLRGDKILNVAKKSQAQAIHPGYGFLSENADFADHCFENDIIFIGPPASAIRDMGIKSTSKNIMNKAGVPIVPGYHGNDQSDNHLFNEAKNIGFPVMIKAVKGGGGKGMRIVFEESEFEVALESARRESLRAFGDDAVLIEKFIKKPRHIEVQIFGDKFGNYVHLFERDCSIQRRHQKVIEQAPAPGIDDTIRAELGKAAVRAAQAVNYVGAGTVEFIFDTLAKKFYFMEMNTRLQVEHPITEMITGIDLVEWQLRIASSERIPKKQENIMINGNAIESRIYAENVSNNFLPTAGHIDLLDLPKSEPNIRIDTGIRAADDVSVHYDPMIAKLIVWEKEDKQAFKTMKKSLSEFNITGIENNVEFLRKLCCEKDLLEGNVHTGFIEEHKSSLITPFPPENVAMQAALGLLLLNKRIFLNNSLYPSDPFNLANSYRVNNVFKRKIDLIYEGKEFQVNISCNNDESFDIEMNGKSLKIIKVNLSEKNGFTNIKFVTLENILTTKLAISGKRIYVFDKISGEYVFELVKDVDWLSEFSDQYKGINLTISPMPGIVEKINVKKGDFVKKGDPVAVVIAMKMEYIIKASSDGKVEDVCFSPGDNIGKNVSIIKLSEESS